MLFFFFFFQKTPTIGKNRTHSIFLKSWHLRKQSFGLHTSNMIAKFGSQNPNFSLVLYFSIRQQFISMFPKNKNKNKAVL